MGVGGKFWDVLKPYAKQEGPDFLREKRVAIDLSFWIVQQETATINSNSYVRKPHLRLTFFRTINLFSKFGAYPVFVVDGTPSPLKSQARIARFFRFSGLDASSLPVPEDGVSVERNRAFLRCVQECVELLELFGMPVLRANGEAEALCAQLNCEGHVDACITADSDAFLFGAKCVIKSLRPNTKEPFECYHMSDIEAGLGLKRQHLMAISLLVRNDHDLSGVQGIGMDTALRFVRKFGEDEILDGLHEIGNGNIPHLLQGVSRTIDNANLSLNEASMKSKPSHCSFCGHPGSKRAHLKSPCECCGTNNSESCMKKPEGFRCNCSSCDEDQKVKELQKLEKWHLKVCNKIQKEPNFPNTEIIHMYLCNNHGQYTDGDPCLSWRGPDVDMLVDFLVFHLLFEPSYIRQRMLPVLSTIYLRKKAAKPEEKLLCDQYEFDSIQRIKVRYGHQSFVIKWRKTAHTISNSIAAIDLEDYDEQEEVLDIDEPDDLTDEVNLSQILVDESSCFLLTDENMELFGGAFPEEVDKFLNEKEQKESKRKRRSSLKEMSESPKSKGAQLSITEYYRSTKVKNLSKQGEEVATKSGSQNNGSSTEKGKASSSSIPKSVRRRLLFR